MDTMSVFDCVAGFILIYIVVLIVFEVGDYFLDREEETESKRHNKEEQE